MEKKILEEICKSVYEQYPFIRDVLPEIKSQPNGTQILFFKSAGNISVQKSLPIQVRVLVDKNGKIIKLSSSR